MAVDCAVVGKSVAELRDGDVLQREKPFDVDAHRFSRCVTIVVKAFLICLCGRACGEGRSSAPRPRLREPAQVKSRTGCARIRRTASRER